MKKYLLFDLDGTLTDPKVGITTSVQYALHAFGIEEPDIDKLEPFIGPPLRESFMGFYGMSAEQAERAVAKYRERFQDIGIFENEVYKGIPRMLRNLQSHGVTLAVASSKPQVFVERILDHFKLRKYFAVVVGSELDGRRENKDEVVREALNRLFDGKPIERDQVYMIGDRRFDVEGARALQVESVGVTYGYGSMEELWEAKADYIVQSVAELEDFLMRGAEEEEEAKRGGPVILGIQRILLYSLIFVLVRNLVAYLFALGGYDNSIVSAIGFAAAGLVLWRGAGRIIARTAREMKLSHLKRAQAMEYVLMALTAAGAALGLNLLFELVQFASASNAYQEVAAKQYSLPFVLGLVIYGLISPLSEELLFRGVIHNCLRRFLSPGAALVLSSALFGLYHMNLVQGIYGFLMGCLIAYAYEYFGDFKMAVAVHGGVNALVFCLTYVEIDLSGPAGWVVCAALLVLAAGSLRILSRQKRVL